MCVFLLPAVQWDTETGSAITAFTGHTNGITALALEKNSLFTSSADHTIALWDPRLGGKRVREFEGHTNVVSSLALCDGALFSGSLDGSVLRWDIGTGKRVSELVRPQAESGGQITSMCASDNVSSSKLYTAACDLKNEQGIVQEWDTRDGTVSATIKVGAYVPWCICVSKKRLFVGCDDKMTKMWELSMLEGGPSMDSCSLRGQCSGTACAGGCAGAGGVACAVS